MATLSTSLETASLDSSTSEESSSTSSRSTASRTSSSSTTTTSSHSQSSTTSTEPSPIPTSPSSSFIIATASSSPPLTTPSDPVSLADGNDTLASPANVGPIVAGSVAGLIVIIVLIVFAIRYQEQLSSIFHRRRRRTTNGNTNSGGVTGGVGVSAPTTLPGPQRIFTQPLSMTTIATGTVRSSSHSLTSPSSSSKHATGEKNRGRGSVDKNQHIGDANTDPLGVGLWRSRSSDDIERGGRSSGEGLGGDKRPVVGLNDSQTRLIAPPSPPQTPQKAASRHSTPITPTKSDMDLRQTLLSRPLSLQIPLPVRAFSKEKKDASSRTSSIQPAVIAAEPPTPNSLRAFAGNPPPNAPNPHATLTPLQPVASPPYSSPSPHPSIPPTSPDRPSTRESVLSGTSSSRSGYFSGASIRTADLFYHPYPGNAAASLGLGTPSRATSVLGGGPASSRPTSSRQGSGGSRPGSRFSALIGSGVASVTRRGSDGTPTPSTRRGSDASGLASENGHGSSSSERRRSTRNSSNGLGPRPSTTGSDVAFTQPFPLSSSPSDLGALHSSSSGSPASGHAWSLKGRTTSFGTSDTALNPSPVQPSILSGNGGSDPNLQRLSLRHSQSDSRLLSSPPSSYVPLSSQQQQLASSSERLIVDPSLYPPSSSNISGGSGSTVNALPNATGTARPDPIVEEDPSTIPHSGNPLLLSTKDPDEAARWRSSEDSYIDFSDDRGEEGVVVRGRRQ